MVFHAKKFVEILKYKVIQSKLKKLKNLQYSMINDLSVDPINLNKNLSLNRFKFFLKKEEKV